MTADRMNKKRGIYIHMPFCVQKCRYCAFLSFTAEGSPRKEYTDALEKEIKLRAALERDNGTDRPIDTIYIGGGTPSVMDISSMSEMVKTLKRSFDVKPDAEFTLESVGLEMPQTAEARLLTSDDMHAHNTFDSPENVVPINVDIDLAKAVTIPKNSIMSIRF